MCEFNKRLQELAENAKRALGELGDFIIERKEINWRPAWGMTMGCIEQIRDIVDNAWEEED